MAMVIAIKARTLAIAIAMAIRVVKVGMAVAAVFLIVLAAVEPVEIANRIATNVFVVVIVADAMAGDDQVSTMRIRVVVKISSSNNKCTKRDVNVLWDRTTCQEKTSLNEGRGTQTQMREVVHRKRKENRTNPPTSTHPPPHPPKLRHQPFVGQEHRQVKEDHCKTLAEDYASQHTKRTPHLISNASRPTALTAQFSP